MAIRRETPGYLIQARKRKPERIPIHREKSGHLMLEMRGKPEMRLINPGTSVRQMKENRKRHELLLIHREIRGCRNDEKQETIGREVLPYQPACPDRSWRSTGFGRIQSGFHLYCQNRFASRDKIEKLFPEEEADRVAHPESGHLHLVSSASACV